MLIVNLIKIGVIWLCDTINVLWDPFEQATLPVVNIDLAGLEDKLFTHLQINHVVNGKFAYQLPMPVDAGDYALFQGVYTAMLAFKGADTAEALTALRALFIENTLIRGIRSDGTINDTTSNDSATGALLGLYAVKDFKTAANWAMQLLITRYALTDQSGVPTQYGQLEDGWKTDPLRITLLLAIFAMARTEDPSFDAPYNELFDKYRALLAYPKIKLLWWDTDYDTHRAAIHLHILYKITGSEEYAKGLRRIYRISEKSNNAWVNVLCAPALPKGEQADISMMYTFTYEDRIKGLLQSINSGRVESVEWGDSMRAKQTLPLNQRGSQDFFWQRNMFSLDEWVGVTEAWVYHSGLDFLVCYWLAKREGIL